jgi:hypothetical protein
MIGSEKEGERILKENKEFEISERDALIIGLLKVIETDNLIHKFNGYIVDLLTNKSINDKGQVLIRKKVIDVSVDKFLDKFPPYWVPNLVYKKSLLRHLIQKEVKRHKCFYILLAFLIEYSNQYAPNARE